MWALHGRLWALEWAWHPAEINLRKNLKNPHAECHYSSFYGFLEPSVHANGQIDGSVRDPDQSCGSF